MASPLEAQIKKAIYQGFRGKLLKGTLRREQPSSVDTLGDEVQGAPATYSFEGIRENFDAAYAAKAGIPVTDVKILIIAGSISVEPKQNDKVQIRGAWHQVRRILAIDPASASYSLQAYEIPDPS